MHAYFINVFGSNYYSYDFTILPLNPYKFIKTKGFLLLTAVKLID